MSEWELGPEELMGCVEMPSSFLRGLFCAPGLRLGPAWVCMTAAGDRVVLSRGVRQYGSMSLFHESVSERVCPGSGTLLP